MLVILVVFIFLQGWRATLIPLLAVPVSLVGTFMLFPMLGFSINTLSLFGLVLAIGSGRGRRHCGGRGGRAPHRARHVAEGRHLQGHGGGLRPGDRDRAHPGRGLRADRVHPGDYRTAVPAVRRDDCRIRGHLGVQRAHAQPGALESALAAEETGQRPAGRLLRLVQPMVRSSDRRLRRDLRSLDPQSRTLDGCSWSCLRLPPASSAPGSRTASCRWRTKATSI